MKYTGVTIGNLFWIKLMLCQEISKILQNGHQKDGVGTTRVYACRNFMKILKIQKFKNVDFSNGKYFLKNTLFRS